MTRISVAIIVFVTFFTAINQIVAQDFRVQIAAYGESMPASFFKEYGIVDYVETSDQLGIYRYVTGAFNTRDDAEALLKEVAAKGFPYARIIDREEQRVLCGAGCPYVQNGMVYRQELQQQETSNTIYFDFGQFSLGPESKTILNRFYEQLRDNPALKLKIHAFTDGVGSRDANLELSANRSRAARNYLVYKGIRADRMLMEVFGEANPVLANKDESDDKTDAPENRKWNRRVVLELVKDFGEAANSSSVISN